MGTFNHKLRENKSTQTPTRFIFYDTETVGEKIDQNITRHRLEFGFACFVEKKRDRQLKEDWIEFHTPSEFWDWVEKISGPRRKTILVAHNQNYDFLILNGFQELANRYWEMRKIITDNGIWYLKYKKYSETLEVLDTFNYFKHSLKKLGENLGLEKLEIDFENATLNEKRIYCKRDVEIVKKTFLNWVNFIKENDLGTFAPTLASQSFNAYRHRFMPYPIFVHGQHKAVELERSSYRGGRNECFFIGEISNVHYFDFNSLYPSAMKDNDFPTKLIRVINEPKKSKVSKYIENGISIIADCVINIDKPVIAYKTEKLIFPIGKFRVTLTTPEIQCLLKNDYPIVFNEMAIYESFPIFYDFVVDLYNMRQKFKNDGNMIYDNLTKILLNSLYGKFGQKLRKTQIIGDCDNDLVSIERCINADTMERYTLRYVGGKILKSFPVSEESIHSFPAIASHVTAFARMKLWDAIELAGKNNVYYVDTDSLFVNDEGKNNLSSLINEIGLGKLKHEYSTKRFKIYGCKDYITDKEIKIKGIKKDAEKLNENEFSQIKFNKFNSMIRKGTLSCVDIETVIKRLSREYDKGIVTECGEVLPFKLDYP